MVVQLQRLSELLDTIAYAASSHHVSPAGSPEKIRALRQSVLDTLRGMPPPRICAAICSWQDGPALENALASIEGVVDRLVIADGLIDGIEAHGLPPFSDLDWLHTVAPNAVVEQRRWKTQSQQRDWTLQTARELGCDWLLVVDADEELRNGDMLRPWLQVWAWDAFPIPFYFDEERKGCPSAWHCLHIPDWRRYVCQGNMLENNNGEIVQLVGQTWWTQGREHGMPYLAHRPELRPEARRNIRLSDFEVALEPYPDDVKVWLEPTYTPALLEPDGLLGSIAEAAELGLPIFYCPGCGRRYAGPGSCAQQHERIVLLPVEVAAAA